MCRDVIFEKKKNLSCSMDRVGSSGFTLAEPSDVNDLLHRLVTEELETVCLIVLIASLSAGSVVWH